MIIRKTQGNDLEEVMRIYERAVRYMAETGNPNQWMAGYPSQEMIMGDINRGVSYVMEENGRIEAVFAYIEGIEPTYGNIENGMWRSPGMYGTIHRLASAGRQRGIAKQCFAWCEQQALMHKFTSLRADTHTDNKIMQRVLVENGFVYRGIIRLADGAPRLAYERILWQEKKGNDIGLGIASMVLGIVSLLLFCTCINFITAVTAIILGIIQICNNKEKSLAIVGITTSAVSLVLALLLWITFTIGVGDMGINSYEEFYDSYYDSYYDDNYDDYFPYNNFDEYYYYEEQDGAEFL